MSKLVLTRGVPASGKTTFAKEWVAEDPTRRARVNRDDFRAMLFAQEGKLDFTQEKTVSAVQQASAKRLLAQGIDVIVDDTNLVSKFVKMWFGISPEVVFVDFPISMDEAIDRDFIRYSKGQRSVGADVIEDYFKRFINKDGSLRPAPINESLLVAPKMYVPGPIRAVSFDLDGTLAHMHDRSPYDRTKYLTDTVDEHVREVLWRYDEAGYDIIILTARDEEGREDTEQWLSNHGIYPDLVLMRKLGDTRNDTIVKSEIVDEHLSYVYDIRMHFDDRNRVVDGLRAKGIKVAQVNPGDF